MKKTVVFLILALTLATAGYYGATWYGTSQTLQRLKTDMAGAGVLKWRSISPSLVGKVRVSELRLMLFELNQPIRIQSAVFDAGSPQALMQWLFDSSAGWPPLARLTLEDVQLILRPDMIKSWVARDATEGKEWPRPWHLRRCGERKTLRGADLMTMGIDTLDMDLTLDWKRGSTAAASVRGEVRAGVLGSIDITMESEQLPDTIAGLANGFPRQWASLQLIVRDGGFMRRLAAFCARDRYGSPEDWAQVAAGELQRELARWGVQPGGQLVALYRQWLYEGGAISLELPATQGPGLTSLKALAAYLEREDPIILYNNQRLADVDLTLVVEDFSAHSAPVVSDPVTEPPQVDEPGWRDTPLASASQWRERRVRVTLAAGRILEGRLSAISGQQLQVTRLVKGGEFTSSADRREITAFEVWRRKNDEPID